MRASKSLWLTCSVALLLAAAACGEPADRDTGTGGGGGDVADGGDGGGGKPGGEGDGGIDGGGDQGGQPGDGGDGEGAGGPGDAGEVEGEPGEGGGDGQVDPAGGDEGGEEGSGELGPPCEELDEEACAERFDCGMAWAECPECACPDDGECDCACEPKCYALEPEGGCWAIEDPEQCALTEGCRWEAWEGADGGDGGDGRDCVCPACPEDEECPPCACADEPVDGPGGWCAAEPQGCWALEDPQSCADDPACIWWEGDGGGVDCACPACGPDEDCEPCDCADDGAWEEEGFCGPRGEEGDWCEELDLEQCAEQPGCAVIAAEICEPCACPDGAECDCPDACMFDQFCSAVPPDRCIGADELACADAEGCAWYTFEECEAEPMPRGEDGGGANDGGGAGGAGDAGDPADGGGGAAGGGGAGGCVRVSLCLEEEHVPNPNEACAAIDDEVRCELTKGCEVARFGGGWGCACPDGQEDCACPEPPPDADGGEAGWECVETPPPWPGDECWEIADPGVCADKPACDWVDGGACACPACAADEPCPPCDCDPADAGFCAPGAGPEGECFEIEEEGVCWDSGCRWERFEVECACVPDDPDCACLDGFGACMGNDGNGGGDCVCPEDCPPGGPCACECGGAGGGAGGRGGEGDGMPPGDPPPQPR